MNECKIKIMKSVEARQLSSIMNNTKWFELLDGIKKLSFSPPYIYKGVLDNDTPDLKDMDVSYLGNYEDEIIKPFFAIEWIAVRPRYLKYRGRLISGEIIDETDAFIDILNTYNIPYELINGFYVIYGYK
mgnify:CR=1 FL=1